MKNRAYQNLPEGYSPIFEVDLKNNKKQAILVNVLALIIAAVMVVPAAILHPFDLSDGLADSLRFFALGISAILYLVLHELTHGVTMKLFGTKKVKYGFTGLYAFAGSADYYPKLPYIAIALAPVVLFGIIFAVALPFVPEKWFWVVYILQLSNIAGAAGDFYVTVRFFGMPKDILVHDSGTSMTVYSEKGAK
jgi:hypothetical protein